VDRRAKVQTGRQGYAARGARVPGPVQRLGVSRGHVQPRDQRQQLGGRALLPEQLVREHIPDRRRCVADRYRLFVSVASTASTSAAAVRPDYVARSRQRRHGLRHAEE